MNGNTSRKGTRHRKPEWEDRRGSIPGGRDKNQVVQQRRALRTRAAEVLSSVGLVGEVREDVAVNGAAAPTAVE